MKRTQVVAQDLVLALSEYEQDHGRFPERLEALVPTYISNIPQTTTGQSFEYTIDDLQGYYLCFYVTRSTDWGCCFNQRLEMWDCAYGYGE
jgi:hypothetical protein